MNKRITMRSSTLQLWIIIIFAMLMTAALFIVGWYRGQTPGFWPSVAGIIFSLWAAVSMMMKYIENRKARENTVQSKDDPVGLTTPVSPGVPGWANEILQKLQEFISKK
jgi:membrane protein YdbS with pleckstrin-like domain